MGFRDNQYICGFCGEWVHTLNRISHNLRDDYAQEVRKASQKRVEYLLQRLRVDEKAGLISETEFNEQWLNTLPDGLE